MDNANQEKDDGKIWWRKTGGGIFRMGNGKIIKPNQKFKALPEEIPEGFRDVVIPIDKLPEEAPLEITPPGYTPEHIGSGWYNVVDGNGKIMNEKSLRPDAAKDLIARLMQ